jgi:hypothetical protein
MSTEEKAPWFAAAAKRAKEERERRVGLGEGGQVELIWVEREARERKKRTRRRVVKNTFKDVDTHTDSDAISESGVTVSHPCLFTLSARHSLTHTIQSRFAGCQQRLL